MVGIYFQLQEGEIHFYNYLKGKEKSYFDGKIMSSISKPVFDKMGDKYSRFKKIGIPLVNMTQPEKTDYINFNSAVQNLGSAHTGIDNFY